MTFIYVSQTATNGYGIGDDARSAATAANKATPLLTVESALSKLTAGDELVINDGVYNYAASYYNNTKQVTITAENDYAVTLQSGHSTRCLYFRTATAGSSVGKIIVDAQGSNNYAVETDPGGVDGFTLDGTRIINPARSWYRGPATNVEIKNFDFQAANHTNESLGFLDMVVNAAGSIKIHNGTFTVSSNYSTNTKELISLYPTVDNVTLEYHDCQVNIIGTSGDTVNVCIASGVSQFDVYDNNHAMSGNTTVSAFRIDPHATITCDRGEVYRLTGALGGTEGYFVRIGAEADTNRDKIDNVWLYDNNLTGANHGYMFGYITGAKGWGNEAGEVDLAYNIKGGNSCEFNGNIAIDIRANGNAFRFKGATNCIFGNNTHIQTVPGSIRSEYATIDGAVDTTGSKFINNITYDVTGASQRLAEADANSITTTWQNCNYYTTSAFATPFLIGTTSYATVALFNGAVTVSDCIATDPELTNYAIEDYAPDSTSPCIGGAVKWWGTNARPEGYDGEPFPDTFIDIGAIQSTFNVNHPINL